MNNGTDVADQIVNMSFKGIEVLAKISGEGAKSLPTYLYAVLKDQKKTRGKTRLEGLLRSGKELKVFAVKNEDLKKFTQEVKRYGVLYCAVRDKNDTDGMCDIMVRAISIVLWNASSWPPWRRAKPAACAAWPLICGTVGRRKEKNSSSYTRKSEKY